MMNIIAMAMAAMMVRLLFVMLTADGSSMTSMGIVVHAASAMNTTMLVVCVWLR